jgi:hypothetical protein
MQPEHSTAHSSEDDESTKTRKCRHPHLLQLLMGVATADFGRENPDIERVFKLTDKGILIVFIFELTLQFIYHGKQLFTDAWLLSDLRFCILKDRVVVRGDHTGHRYQWLGNLGIVGSMRSKRACRMDTVSIGIRHRPLYSVNTCFLCCGWSWS